MRMFGRQNDQQARTNEASTSGLDGQSAASQEKRDNEQLHCQADSHYARGDYGQAKPLYKSLLPLYVQEFGAGDIKTALVQNGLANIYKKSGKHKKAIALYECVLPTYKRKFGEYDPKTKKVQKNLESTAEKLGQPLESSSGRKLGNYQLLKPLGAGGFGDVYLGARIDAPEKKVAIKMLKPTHLTDPEIVKGFREEAGNLLRLKHEHIVKVEEVGTAEDNAPYLVMEYAPNGTLRDVHPENTCVPLWKVVKYVNQIASALQYMHDEKLIHMDLKPENVLIGADGQILLSDFGLAQTVHNTVSQPTLYMGTFKYAAPEHLHYGKPCKESDQYSLGVMVYEWLSGKRPFFLHAPHPDRNVRFEPLHGRIQGISRKIEQVVFKALKPKPKNRFTVERNPGERIPSVKAFAEAFEQACKELFKSSKFLKSSEGIEFLKSSEGIDFLKSSEGIDFLKSREGIGFLKSREGIDFLKSSEGIDFLKSSEGIDFPLLTKREGTNRHAEQQRTDRVEEQASAGEKSRAEYKLFIRCVSNSIQEVWSRECEDTIVFDRHQKPDKLTVLSDYLQNPKYASEEFQRCYPEMFRRYELASPNTRIDYLSQDLEEIALNPKEACWLRETAIKALVSANRISDELDQKLKKFVLYSNDDSGVRAIIIEVLASAHHISDEFSRELEKLALNPKEQYWLRERTITALASAHHISDEFSRKLEKFALNQQEDDFVCRAAIVSLARTESYK